MSASSSDFQFIKSTLRLIRTKRQTYLKWTPALTSALCQAAGCSSVPTSLKKYKRLSAACVSVMRANPAFTAEQVGATIRNLLTPIYDSLSIEVSDESIQESDNEAAPDEEVSEDEVPASGRPNPLPPNISAQALLADPTLLLNLIQSLQGVHSNAMLGSQNPQHSSGPSPNQQNINPFLMRGGSNPINSSPNQHIPLGQIVSQTNLPLSGSIMTPSPASTSSNTINSSQPDDPFPHNSYFQRSLIGRTNSNKNRIKLISSPEESNAAVSTNALAAQIPFVALAGRDNASITPVHATFQATMISEATRISDNPIPHSTEIYAIRSSRCCSQLTP